MKKAIATILFAALAFTSAAQHDRWNFYAGWSLPLGDYAKADLASNRWALTTGGSLAGAGMGGNLGMAYHIPTRDSSRMSIALSTDLVINGVNSEIRVNRITTLANLRRNFATVKLTQPLFLHIPVLAGLHYETPINQKYNFYVTAQAGLGFNIITNRSAEMLGGAQPIEVGNLQLYDYSYVDHYSTKVTAAWRVAVGLTESRHWLADLGLWGMGAVLIEGYEDFNYRAAGDRSLQQGSMVFKGDFINPLMFIARIGYRL